MAGIQAVVDIPFPAAVGSPCQDTAAVDSTPVAEGRRRSKAREFNIKNRLLRYQCCEVRLRPGSKTKRKTSTIL